MTWLVEVKRTAAMSKTTEGRPEEVGSDVT